MKKEHEVYTVLKNINDETFKPELVLFQDAPGSGKSHGLAKVIAEDIQKVLSVGMNDHVAKPVDMNILVPTMMKYL